VETRMKLVFGILVFAVVFLLVFTFRNRQMHKTTQKADPQVYFGLRDMMLHTSRERIGIPKPANQNEPWGVMMDWGIPTGSATTVALADGTASVYLSSGGGFIGGESHESIRNAAKQAVEAAKGVQPLTQLTTDYPIPQRGGVIFYLFTDSGVFTGNATEEQLRTHQSPLHKLRDAAQNVITEYRRIQ